MKKLLLLIFILPTISFSQSFGNYSTQIGLGVGYVENGVGISLNVDYYLNRFDYIQTELLLGFASDKVSSLEIKVPYDTFTINGGYFKEVATLNRDAIAFKVGGGVSLGYQIINNGNKDLSSGALIESDSKFIYGLYIGAESIIYLNETFQTALKYKQFYRPNSDIGKFTPYIAVSLIYSLY